jgi:hypothetical protein
MNKKVLIGIIVAVVAIVAIVWIVMAVNSNNNQGGGNGGDSLNQSSEITDTSVEGDVVEGSSIVVTGIEKGALGARITVVNAGETKQNHLIVATFLDANGNEIATGEAPATLDPGEEKESILPIDGDWEDYDSVTYKVKEE